jgi:glycosyltransferase involved in cell wall biosynthesis
MSTIDVLLPFYGDVDYLRLAVRSVLAQTDHDWRLLVVDDGYPDPGVASWFEELSHPQVHYTRNPTNLGANENYRHALSMARADRVVVMGADDLMLPNYVATVRQLFSRHPRAVVVQPGVGVIDEAGRPVTPLVDRVKQALRPSVSGSTELSGERLATSLLHGNWTYFPSLCWDRALMTAIGFRPGLDVVQDLALLLDVVAGDRTLVVGEDVAFLYRRHLRSDSSLRAASGSRFVEEREFFRSTATTYESIGWRGAHRAARWHATSRLNAASLVPTAVRARQWSAATSLLKHAVTC